MPEVEASRRVVFELIGRNVMRFQRLELMLKFALYYTDVQLTDIDLKKGPKGNDFRGNRDTFGALAGQTYKSLIIPLSQEDAELPDAPLPEGARIRFKVSFKYKTSPALHKEAQDRLKRLVKTRNELIHASFLIFDLETTAGCAEALAHLDQQAIELISEIEHFKFINEVIQNNLRFMNSKEYREAFLKSFREFDEQSKVKGSAGAMKDPCEPGSLIPVLCNYPAEQTAITMNLSRFLDAQVPIYADALAELRAGQKRTHWMWFVFPQLRGLGHSEKATYYGLADAGEAVAYLTHPVLGARLRECITALLAHREKSAHAILGSPDDLKFRSCLTLFGAVAGPDDSLWQEALDRFFAGEPDAATLRLLGRSQ